MAWNPATQQRGSLPYVALQNAEVRCPGTHGQGIRACHGPRDLSDVREIVHHPRGEQLPHRDHTELRMLARQPHVLLLEVPAAQSRDIARPQVVELLQQILERPFRFQFRETIERIEPAVTLLLQNYACARNPISSLAMDEMCDDLPRIPRVRSFVHTC